MLAKLAERKIDTSLFTSTKSLGQGHETKKQVLGRALREEKAGIGRADLSESVLYEERRGVDESDEDGNDEAREDLSEDGGNETSRCINLTPTLHESQRTKQP